MRRLRKQLKTRARLIIIKGASTIEKLEEIEKKECVKQEKAEKEKQVEASAQEINTVSSSGLVPTSSGNGYAALTLDEFLAIPLLGDSF